MSDERARNFQVHSSDLERARFLLGEALDEDEAENTEEAIKLYSEAVELCLKARTQTKDKELASNLTKVRDVLSLIPPI